MLDTTRLARATIPRVRRLRYIYALYNAIARAHRFEPPTFMNCSIQAVSPSCKRTYFARSWMLKGSRTKSQCARCARPHRFPSRRHLDVVQPLLTDDLVFELPSHTCSAQMRIRISSRPSCALAPFRSARRSFPACESVVYDMHRDH
ncbi:hypothetical protein B0H13DRAFT_2678029 [Mycena leptocephala]|nr:hypothetical protein B0H13DRAFT_2678029 [Mycena leptocephala]